MTIEQVDELLATGKRLQEAKAEVTALESKVAELVRATAGEVTPTDAARMTGLSRPTIYKMRGD